ncbi:MAG: hypothetical protein A3E87_01800 [Gammaproteobacteria bacterium RIFCSPHIGHO2_12_FULL_35_23]|nr:MAG: hypothetical protein A3E87_01800 [Gammaproteobacteria bacterium RIFCSPHIGHO2_12_FULL_35_23]
MKVYMCYHQELAHSSMRNITLFKTWEEADKFIGLRENFTYGGMQIIEMVVHERADEKSKL